MRAGSMRGRSDRMSSHPKSKTGKEDASKVQVRPSCPACNGGVLVPADDIISLIDGHVFVERGARCTLCGEEFVPEGEGQRTIEIALRLGLWGPPLKLYRKLTRSGRGIVLRIPADLERNMGLSGDEEVAISKVGNGRILVEVITDPDGK